MAKKDSDFEFEVEYVDCNETADEQKERENNFIDLLTEILIEHWSQQKNSDSKT